jgi:hypothetical protein
MSDLHSSSGAPRVPRRVALLSLLAATGVIVLPGCGGGGGGGGGGNAGIDTGGTGSFSTGTISGFGSVIVNGVRFDDNGAHIEDEDTGVQLREDDLKLGMVVRIQGSAITAGSGDVLPTATATSIVVESQIKGPVQAKTAPDTLVVFGQTVKVTAATVFEPGLTFAAITVGDILEVHGFVDAAGVVTATRIERENLPDEFKVRGFIANLDNVAKTFTIGAATFNFSAALRLPDTPLANGQFVRVRTHTAPNALGQFVVNRIDLRAAIEDRNEAEVEGILTAVTVNGATQLQVNGIVINPNGLTVPAIGTRVEVEGAIVNGVLVARKIEVENENEEAQVDVRGTVSNLNTAAQTFVVRGVTFHFSTATDFRNGTAANLATANVNVRVRGTLVAGTSTVEATRIDF